MSAEADGDLVRLAVGLGRALVAEGVRAGTARARAFALALRAAPPASIGDLYWTARIAMLPRIEDLQAFNTAFFSSWGNPADPDMLRLLAESVQHFPASALTATEQRAIAPLPSEEFAGESDAEDAPFVLAMASPEERLAERDFADFSEDERANMLRLIGRLRAAVETRPSRRRRPDLQGDRLDLRATARAAARTSGELIRRKRTQRRPRVRPLVFLCDVSGSMAPYARALIQYARANAFARPRVRAFAFATRLTDLGPALSRTSDAAASRAVTERLQDFGGGTRIGAALRAFNDRYAQRGAARGGTVVILSDGWERDDPELVRSQMERLARLSRRIVWVNPQKKHPAFEPLALGMAAALPFVDAFVGGHNLRTLDAVAEAIEGTGEGSR